MDNKILREKFREIFDIRQIFLDAKSDNGDTFIKEINKLDKNILKKQLEFYKQGTIEKVKKVRYDIIKYILDGKKITKEKILEFKEYEAKKHSKRIFKSWTFFSILHSIYYFDKKEFVVNFLKELNERLILDLGISDYVKLNIVDFQGAQNFGLENFWTAIYNKNHKSQKTAKQLNITSFGNNGESLDYGYLSIGLGNGPEAESVSDRNHNFFHINELTYEIILEEFEKYKNMILEDKNQDYWLYAPGENAKNWEEERKKSYISIGWDKLGDLRNYKTKEDLEKKYIEIYGKKQNNNILANGQFVNEMKIGDIIIVKKGSKKLLGYGIVDSDYFFDENAENHKSRRKVVWKEIKEVDLDDIAERGEGAIKQLVLKTLTIMSPYPDLLEYLLSKFNINNKNSMSEKFQKEVELLNNKKQIILYGPPGTGKTYNVKSIIEEHSGGENYEDLKKDGKVEFITFHQSFSYEEFIEGIKPDLENDSQEISYQIEDGIFKKICEKAKTKSTTNIKEKIEWLKKELLEKGEIEINENSNFILRYRGGKTFRILPKNSKNKDGDYPVNINSIIRLYETNKKDLYNSTYAVGILEYLYKNGLKKYEEIDETSNKNYYLIIDEINRGNISKIFGELITLLEADKRNKNWKTKLPYSKKDFWIPENLYIIATMNTSDKSIVSLDTALRRRFGFVEMLPDYNLEELQKEIKGIKLANILEKLNNRIEYLLDKDHLIGHSYFLQKIENIGDLKRIFINEIYPLLEEYFYSEEENIRKVLGKNFFEEQKIDSNLFEEKIEEEEKKYIFKKNITNEEFEEILKNY